MKDLKEVTWGSWDIVFQWNTSKDTHLIQRHIQLPCQCLAMVLGKYDQAVQLAYLDHWEYTRVTFLSQGGWDTLHKLPYSRALSRYWGNERGLHSEISRLRKVSSFAVLSLPSWITNTILLLHRHGCCHSILIFVNIFGILAINLVGNVIW